MSDDSRLARLEQDVERLLDEVKMLRAASSPVGDIDPLNWLRFLHSFALSDHVGDASDSVRSFAELSGLPMPPDEATLDDWLDWVKERGIEEGCSAEILRRRGGQ